MSDMQNSRLRTLGNVPCLLLVGGLGTRLRSLVKDTPKPMATISGRPFLEYLVRWLHRFGFRKLIFCVGYRAGSIQRYFQDGAALGVQIAYAVEDQPLGTWGAIRQASRLMQEPDFLVLNGDSWAEVDLRELFDFHVRTGGIATIAAVALTDCSRFGSLQIDHSARIVTFVEKDSARRPGLVNAGVYVFSREALAVAPAGAFSVERDVFPALIPRGLYATPVHGYFVDIGIPEEYKRLQKEAEAWIDRMELHKDETVC